MIKRKLALGLMLLVLATVVAVTVNAQPGKKNKHKHKQEQASAQDTTHADKSLSKKQEKRLKKDLRKKEKKEHKKEKRERRYNKKHHGNVKLETESGNAPGANVRHFEDEYPLTKIKERYRIDILAPLYLDDLVKGQSVTFKNKIPEKAEQGLAFYEGINIAADSLKKAGFKIDIYVHDIASATEAPEMLVVDNKLDSTDLIIGDVAAKDIPMLAAYARKKQVNFVSAIAAGDGGVKNNPYFTVMQPSLKSHCEWIAGNVATKYKGSQAIMLYRTTVAVDENAYNYVAGDDVYHVHFRELKCNTMPAKEQLARMVDTTRPNVVIIPIADPAYADSLLTELSRDFPFTRFEVYGMPSWSSINNLHKQNGFPNLAVNITRPFYIDANSASAKYVARVYRSDYNTKAPELVYRGYEAMFWYANLLRHYGTIFNVKYEDNTLAPFTSFEMRAQMDRSGNTQYYENKHVFLSRFEGGVNKTE